MHISKAILFFRILLNYYGGFPKLIFGCVDSKNLLWTTSQDKRKLKVISMRFNMCILQINWKSAFICCFLRQVKDGIHVPFAGVWVLWVKVRTKAEIPVWIEGIVSRALRDHVILNQKRVKSMPNKQNRYCPFFGFSTISEYQISSKKKN